MNRNHVLGADWVRGDTRRGAAREVVKMGRASLVFTRRASRRSLKCC